MYLYTILHMPEESIKFKLSNVYFRYKRENGAGSDIVSTVRWVVRECGQCHVLPGEQRQEVSG